MYMPLITRGNALMNAKLKRWVGLNGFVDTSGSQVRVIAADAMLH